MLSELQDITFELSDLVDGLPDWDEKDEFEELVNRLAVIARLQKPPADKTAAAGEAR